MKVIYDMGEQIYLRPVKMEDAWHSPRLRGHDPIISFAVLAAS